MKRSIAILGILCLGAATAFAGGQAEEVVEDVDRIRVLSTTTSSEDYIEYVKETYYNETGIEVEWEVLPFTAYMEALEVQLSAGDQDFDVFNVDVPLVASYAIRNFLLPLDDFFTEAERESWLPSAYEAGTHDGVLVSPPMRTSTQLLYYNKDLLDAAGIDAPGPAPEDRLTWEEARAIAEQVADPGAGVWGLVLEQHDRPYQLLPLPESKGGGPGIGEDGLEIAGYLTNDGWIEAMQFYGDKYADGIAPRGTGDQQEMFLAGDVALYVGGEWNLGLLREVDFEWGVAPHPYFEGGEPVTPTGSWHWGVNAHTDRPNAAAAFVKALTTDTTYVDPLLDEGRLVGHRRIAELTMDDVEEFGLPFTPEALSLVQYELEHTARPRPASIGYLEWEDMVRDAILDIVAGEDVEETLRRTEDRLDREFEKYRR